MTPRGLVYSSTFHGLLLLLLVFGLPSFMQPTPLPAPMVLSVELLPISELSNVQTSMPKPPKKQQDAKPLPQKEAVKEVKKEEPKKDEPKKEEKKPDPQPEPVKEIIPDKTKEEPKKEEPKKKDEPKKSEEDELAELLNKMAKEKTPPAPKTDKETGTPKEGPKAVSDVPFDQNSPAAMALQDNIRSQIMPCWNYQGGAPEDKIQAARILVSLNPDGTVSSAKLHFSQTGEYHSNGYFRAIVDSAIRATRNPSCTPLKYLPADQYHMWKELVVNFDPRQML